MAPGDEPDGELVESGSFRIDRRRALAKLKDYPLPSRLGAAHLWIRCAIQSDASAIRVLRSHRSFELSFDGRPFSRTELQDPYGVLFGAAVDERGRDLALGLLLALRTDPAELVVASGCGSRRAQLRIAGLDQSRVEDARTPGPETVIRAAWPFLHEADSVHWHLRPFDYETLCAMSPVPLYVSGRRAAPLPPEAHRFWEFGDGPLRARLTVPAYPDLKTSRIRLFCRGVFVCYLEHKHALARVAGDLNADDLSLTASMSGFAHDPAFRRAAAKLEAWTEELIARVIEDHWRRLPETGRRLARGSALSGIWRRRMELGPNDPNREANDRLASLIEGWFPSVGRRQAQIARVLWDAHVTVWLRALCERWAWAVAAGAPRRARGLLDRAPVMLDRRGAPLTLRDLRERCGAPTVRWAPHPGGPAAQPRTPWCISTRDLAWLRRIVAPRELGR